MLPGMDKKNSYDLFWLRDDMMTMSNLFEYSDRYAQMVYGFTGIWDRFKFAEELMNSAMRHEMDLGHPQLLSESIREVFEAYITVDCNGDFEKYRTVEPNPELAANQMYWVGAAYAYIHYHADMLSKDVYKKLPLEEMLHYYITGHQLDYDQFYDSIKDALL